MTEEKNNEKKKESQKDDKKKKPEILTEGITFLTCPIHNFSYPKGTTCPKCDAANK